MFEWSLDLGPLHVRFCISECVSAEGPPEREYVPAAQVERADAPLAELGPDQHDGRIGFTARG